MPRRRDPITQTRSGLYKTAKILGDIQAVRKGRITERLTNRLIGRLAGRVTGRMWR